MPKKTNPQINYKTITGRDFAALLHPRPAILVTCCDTSGVSNILTIAWHTPLSYDPPLVGISVGVTRYSHSLISQVGEFVINIVDVSMIDALKTCGQYTGELDDKASLANLSLIPAKKVRPPLIAGANGYLECLVEQEVDAGDHTFFIAKVLLAQAAETAFSNMWVSPQGNIPLCLQRDQYGIYQDIGHKD
ncbi:MAG: flavin reductase family protein [Anaerolineales bacterium]|nr:flavin reductase family protein [Anaerolineales bacterium]